MAINVKDKLVTLESLGVAYSAEQDAREEADQALSTRIDNIVAPDGDPSLTEVSDARVSGSTTHNTLKARLDADKTAIETEISQLSADLGAQDKYTILLNDEVPNTTQEYTFSNGKVSQVAHSRNSSSVRTDAFTYGTGTITEVRTLSTGENLTIVTNLTTLETTITYSED